MNGYPPYQNYPNYPNNYPNYSNYQQQPVPNQILAWIKNEDEAVNFPLNIGQSIFLLSQKEDYLYMKSVDQLGKVTFIKKRLIDETENKDSEQLKDYIRKEELENLISDKIREEIDKKFSEISFKPARATKAKQEEEG